MDLREFGLICDGLAVKLEDGNAEPSIVDLSLDEIEEGLEGVNRLVFALVMVQNNQRVLLKLDPEGVEYLAARHKELAANLALARA